MSLSLYLSNALLNHLFGNVVYTMPLVVHVGLSTTTPNDDGTGITEPNIAAGYSRVSVTSDTNNWETSTIGQKRNKIDFIFPEATGPWGNLTHAVVMDLSVGGNMLASGKLTTARNIVAGDRFRFPAGSLVINLD